MNGARHFVKFACVLAVFALAYPAIGEQLFDRGIAPDDIRSGITFQQADTQALQNDDFANPGFLWVDRGKELFAERPAAEGKACAACHGADGQELNGVAARYPAVDAASGTLFNLETRIQNCQQVHQGTEPSVYESEALLSLAAFVGNLSRGLLMTPTVDGAAQPFFEQGRGYYYARKGQLNLACHHCHEVNWGEMLRGDRLSQGHGNGYPAYRFDWQAIGSLHRRLRNCDQGVRAEPFAFGAPEYVALELYLAWRAAGLTVETPAVRR